MGPMLLQDLAGVSAAVTATSSRTAKTEAIAALLAGAAPEEVGPAVAFLSGRLVQRQIGVGWAQLRDLPPPAAEPSLTVAEVDAAFAAVGELRGPGSQAARREALAALFARADADEQRFLAAPAARRPRPGRAGRRDDGRGGEGRRASRRPTCAAR